MRLFDTLYPYQKKFVNADKKFKIWNSSRQIGKSFCLAYLAALESLRGKNGLSLAISTGMRASDEFIKKCSKMAEAVKILSDGKIDYSESSSQIKFSTGARIVSLPSGNPSALRGYSSDCTIIDECSYIDNQEQVFQAISPTLTRNPEAQLIIASTPSGKNNKFYELFQKAKIDPEWHFQTTTIQDAIKDGLNVDIEKLRRLCPDPHEFSMEYEAQFSDSANALFDIQLLQTYSGDKEFVDFFIGADWARTSDGTSFAVIGRTKDGKCYLVELVNLHNIEYSKQIAVATQLFNKWKPKLFYGDAGGLGSPLMEQLNKTVSALIKPFTFTGSNKNDLYEYFRKQVFDRQFFVKEEFKTQVLEDLNLVQQILTENGKTQYVARRFNGSHADNISALILALHAARQNSLTFSVPQVVQYQSVFGPRTFRF